MKFIISFLLLLVVFAGYSQTTIRVSELPNVTAPTGDEFLLIIQSGISKKGTLSAIVNKTAVGLSNVDNTSDLNKPISTATQTALDGKASSSALTDHTSNTGNPHGVTKSQVGLGNADNTSDVNKPVSSATQTALNAKGDEGKIIPGLVANGTTDNRAAIIAALNASSGELLIIPSGDYFVSGPIDLTGYNKNIRLNVLGELFFAANQDGIIVGGNTLVNPNNRQIVNIYGRLEGANTGTNWNAFQNTSAITVRNSYGNHVYLNNATGWKNAIKLDAIGAVYNGTLYNTVKFDLIDNNAVGVLLTAAGHAGNFVNHNYIYGGAINTGGTGIKSVKNTGQVDPFNGNYFFGVGAELMTQYCVDLDYAEYNFFSGTRFLGGAENPAATNIIKLSATTGKNIFTNQLMFPQYNDDQGHTNDFSNSMLYNSGGYYKGFRYDPNTWRMGIGSTDNTGDFPYFSPASTLDVRGGTVQVRKYIDYDEADTHTYMYMGGSNVATDSDVTKGFAFRQTYTNASTPSIFRISEYRGFDATNRYAVPTTFTDALTISNGKVGLSASTTERAPFNIPHGANPTTPVNGDIWTTTTAVMARVNGQNQALVASNFAALTGNPTAPTQAVGNNTTRIATTAFVTAAVAGIAPQNLTSVLTAGNDAGAVRITNVSDPVNNQDVATKKYVDDNAGGGGGSSIPSFLEYTCSDELSVLITGKCLTVKSPSAFTITGVRASLNIPQSSGSIFTVNIKVDGTTIFSTPLTIDNTEDTSVSAVTPAVISNGAVSDDQKIEFEITQVGDGTAGGLKVKLYID